MYAYFHLARVGGGEGDCNVTQAILKYVSMVPIQYSSTG